MSDNIYTLEKITKKLNILGFTIKNNTVFFNEFRISEIELELFDWEGNFFGDVLPSQELEETLTVENLKLLNEYYDTIYY